MIGRQKPQISLLDSVFNTRTKHSRTNKLLKKIDEFVNWDDLESICKRMYKDSKHGRPSLPIIIALKCLVLQYLYNLSDPALEDALIDRMSFQRFLGISFDTEIPDFTTIWRFRERLIKANLLDKIFESILKQLDKKNVNAVERPFAHFKKHMGFRYVRYVNLERNELHFKFLCMIHNIRRGITLTAPGA